MYVDLPHQTHSDTRGAGYHHHHGIAAGAYDHYNGYRSAGTVTAAKVVLGITTGFLALNLVLSMGQPLPALSYLIVITLTVLVGIATAKVRDSRAWGLGGGSVGVALAGLLLLMMAVVSDLRLPDSVQSALNTTLLISALIYGGLGVTVLSLLNGSTARDYYDI